MPELTLEKLKSHVPVGGLFADREWLWSSKPFELSKRERKTIQRLGQPLHRFQQASDEIYRQSMNGKLLRWPTEALNAGKPRWLLDHQMEPEQHQVTPRVIRPDLLLTENGFSVSELDSVPGGIGTLAWLSQTYLHHAVCRSGPWLSRLSGSATFRLYAPLERVRMQLCTG